VAANRSLDPEDIITQALTLAKAGYEIDPRELSERTGYQLKLRNYALLPLPKAPMPEDVAALDGAAVENEAR